MEIASFLHWLQASKLAVAINSSAYLFPLIESLHVIAMTGVFGTILLVDLRLLGLASKCVPFTSLASDVLRWNWSAFALAVITGSLLFITNADGYFRNFYFRMKMLSIVLAGINAAVFQLTAKRSVGVWDTEDSAPNIGKTVAICSLTIWIIVIFCGRWIGFTTQL